jgi:hypothetical protein
MDNVGNVWKRPPPRSVYDLSDATATTTSTVTNSGPTPTPIENIFAEAMREMQARTTALEQLSKEKENSYQNMDTSLLDDISAKTKEIETKNTELEKWRVKQEEQNKRRFEEHKVYIDKKLDTQKSEIFEKLDSTSTSTKDTLEQMMKLTKTNDHNLRIIINRQGNHMQNQVNQIAANYNSLLTTVTGLQQQIVSVKETQSQMETLDLYCSQDQKRRKETHDIDMHPGVTLRPSGNLVSPAKECDGHQGSE